LHVKTIRREKQMTVGELRQAILGVDPEMEVWAADERGNKNWPVVGGSVVSGVDVETEGRQMFLLELVFLRDRGET
jgi:hypothetical protein